jgi:cytidine deaminase
LEELTESEKMLVEKAKEASFNAYAPYSEFLVGAALMLEDGTVLTGNNQENAAYPSGTCAERAVVFYANANYPNLAVRTIAVAAQHDGGFLKVPIAPCGSCRQVLLETEHRYGQKLRILLYGETEIAVLESVKFLLPLSFGSDELKA